MKNPGFTSRRSKATINFICIATIILFNLFLVKSCKVAESATPAHTDPIEIEAVYVIDGDTFAINGKSMGIAKQLPWKVRIRHIDTPEIKGKCMKERLYALKAKERLEVLLMQSVEPIRFTDLGHDKYGGRLLATVHIGKNDVAKVLINEGLARPYEAKKKKSWCY